MEASDHEQIRAKLDAAEERIAELEQRLAVEGLPADLLAVLREPGVIVGRDGRVFELLAEWRNAPSSTSSSGPANAEGDRQLKESKMGGAEQAGIDGLHAEIARAEAAEQALREATDRDNEIIAALQRTNEAAEANTDLYYAGMKAAERDAGFQRDRIERARRIAMRGPSREGSRELLAILSEVTAQHERKAGG
jgi:hypothetical protein